MSYQEKNNLVTLVSSLVVMGNYFWRMYGMWIGGELDGEAANAIMGQSVLWLILVSIIVNVVAHVIFAVVHAAMTGGSDSSYVVDERDRLIELRGLRIGYYILGAGFVTSMIVLAMGYASILVFILIVFSFTVAGIAENLTRIAMYRWGL